MCGLCVKGHKAEIFRLACNFTTKAINIHNFENIVYLGSTMYLFDASQTIYIEAEQYTTLGGRSH